MRRTLTGRGGEYSLLFPAYKVGLVHCPTSLFSFPLRCPQCTCCCCCVLQSAGRLLCCVLRCNLARMRFILFSCMHACIPLSCVRRFRFLFVCSYLLGRIIGRTGLYFSLFDELGTHNILVVLSLSTNRPRTCKHEGRLVQKKISGERGFVRKGLRS